MRITSTYSMRILVAALVVAHLAVPVRAEVPMANLPTGGAQLTHCLVSVIEDVQVAAQESGLIVEFTAKEGDSLMPGKLMARIDDQQPQLAKQAAEAELKAARQKADDDIEVRYAEAAARVARSEYDQAIDVNRRVPGTVPEAEVRRRELTAQRAELQIIKAKQDLAVAKLGAEVNQAQVRAADAQIQRRKICAPIDGVVIGVFRRAGEWVNPGDPVARVVRMNRLRIEGFLNATEYNPGEIGNRPATVFVELARGRQQQFQGKVTFVSPLVQAGNKYRVRVEVENRAEDDQWLLRPGMIASLSIEVK